MAPSPGHLPCRLCADCKVPKLFTKVSPPHKTPGRPPGRGAAPLGSLWQLLPSLPPGTGSAPYQWAGAGLPTATAPDVSEVTLKSNADFSWPTAHHLTAVLPVSSLETAVGNWSELALRWESLNSKLLLKDLSGFPRKVGPVGVGPRREPPNSVLLLGREGTAESMWSLASPLARPRSPQPQERNEIE